MEYSQEPIPETRSEASLNLHGPDTPFRHHKVISKWIEGLVKRNGYEDFVEYNTTVENVKKVDGEWKVTLRREGPGGVRDYWWNEYFDAVVVASGHYFVPYIPETKGLAEYESLYPGSIEHSKYFRHPESYRGKVPPTSPHPLTALI